MPSHAKTIQPNKLRLTRIPSSLCLQGTKQNQGHFISHHLLKKDKIIFMSRFQEVINVMELMIEQDL